MYMHIDADLESSGVKGKSRQLKEANDRKYVWRGKK